MTKYNISITQEAQFAEVIDIIQQHKSHASQVVNNEILLTAWCVGKYVSEKLKTERMGKQSCLPTIRIHSLKPPRNQRF